MNVFSMEDKVDFFEQLLNANRFTNRELAKIACGMELHACITVLENTINDDQTIRAAMAAVFRQQQIELNEVD